MMRPRLLVVAGFLLAATARPADAQGYFGQNQVQFKQLNWKVITTEHFDVHFYQGMETGARIAARMAERSYARLSRLLNYQFREKKPIVLFASRGDFAQNNVTGDLGEQTGGATDPIRQRNMFFFGQDLAEVEHVMTHEMVHQFQYDVQFRGRGASPAMEAIGGSGPPLWFIEGMAEYLSIGPDHPATDAVIRDAALNGNLPSIQQMADPNSYFPYRFGESVWRFVGKKWGDEIIGEILLSTFSLGMERAFKRYTGYDLDELGDEWKEAMQTQYLPAVGTLDRPRKIAQPLLNARRTGGIIPVYVAPALSSDGRQIAYVSTGSLLRAEVFLDLYLADATTGKRIKKLTNSTMSAETEELRVAYSQAAFSPDGKLLAFTAQTHGKDVLRILDVRSRTEVRQFDTDLDQMIGPTWSPDGRMVAFSGSKGGFSSLYVIDADGKNLRQLTNDTYAALMPQWSPDGKKIAFVSDRGPTTNLTLLKFGKWTINVLDVDTKAIETIPGQSGKNLNPQWAPDGKSLAFISDRTGIAQLFLYDFEKKEHYQLTKFIGGVAAMTENSPAITWAHQADKLAFVYMDNGDFTIWSIANPRQLKKEPFREPVTATIAGAPPADTATENARARATNSLQALAQNNLRAARDSLFGRRLSLYRGATGLRPSEEPPAAGAPGATSAVSVAALMDSAALALPAESSLKEEPYKGTLRPEAILRPQIGYAQDNYAHGVYGGTAILLGDLLDNRQLLLSANLNGRFEEAQVYALYMNSAHRRSYQLGFSQAPYYYLSNFIQSPVVNGLQTQTEVLTRYISREAFASSIYPFNRFNRLELGASFTSLDRADMYVSQDVNYNYGVGSGFYLDSIKGRGTLNYASPFIAYVSDNALHSSTGPIYGHRFRFEVSPIIAKDSGWVNYTADARRYDAILFSFLTLATRFYANMAVGQGESRYLKYIGQPYYIRGYDRENYLSAECGTNGANGTSADASSCSATQLLGSRIALANVELRFPLIRRFDLGFLPISLPPLDGVVFYDAGMAWSAGQTISLTRPDNYDFNKQRFPLRSYGYGLRLNLFNIAVIRWDYAIPRDAFNKKGYWWWSIGPSF